MLTRVFGDFNFKNYGVKCDPFVIRKVIDDNIENQFIIISSDGIWDLFEENDIKEFISELVESNYNNDDFITKIICKNLIDECIKAGGWDNMSIYVIKLT